MRYSYVLPFLALASQVLGAPAAAVVTETNVVIVTAGAEPTESVAPRLGAPIEVIVSKLVKVSGDSTETFITTYTRDVTQSESTVYSSASSATPTSAVELQAEVTSTEPTTTSSARSTTVLEPTTTSQPTTTQAPTTSETSTSTSTSATSTSTAPSDSFAAEILNAHNEKRAENGSPDLSWSDELASYAQAYADKYDCSGTLTHSGGKYGENLGLGYTTTGVVDAWYDEKSYYNPSSPAASHFTQVVWKSTTKLGCAKITCDNIWGQYTICSYDPAGNVGGQYAANV
jgi:uncharacterized protein YkwD